LPAAGRAQKASPVLPDCLDHRAIPAPPVRLVRSGRPVRLDRKVNRDPRVLPCGSFATTAWAEIARPRAAATKCWRALIADRGAMRRRSLASGKSRAASTPMPRMRRWSRFACNRHHDAAVYLRRCSLG